MYRFLLVERPDSGDHANICLVVRDRGTLACLPRTRTGGGQTGPARPALDRRCSFQRIPRVHRGAHDPLHASAAHGTMTGLSSRLGGNCRHRLVPVQRRVPSFRGRTLAHLEAAESCCSRELARSRLDGGGEVRRQRACGRHLLLWLQLLCRRRLLARYTCTTAEDRALSVLRELRRNGPVDVESCGPREVAQGMYNAGTLMRSDCGGLSSERAEVREASSMGVGGLRKGLAGDCLDLEISAAVFLDLIFSPDCPVVEP